MTTEFITVTEIAGDSVTREQVKRLCNRYYWAGQFCTGYDIVEVACGTGQGLGYLDSLGQSFEAGDYDHNILSIAQRYYGERIRLTQFDAQDMPFENNSKDVIVLFEAIYYLPDAAKFVNECVRILRPGGRLLIATANKDLYDFNPSPQSYRYYGVVELRDLIETCSFAAEFYGDTPVGETSLLQRVLRPVKKVAVALHLMPKTMAAKKLIKRIVFGKLVKMPAEITSETAEYVPPTPIPADVPDKKHKVIYCAATLDPQNT